MSKYVILLVSLVFTITLFAQQVEPFSADEGVAIEIYEAALPLLEAVEPLFDVEGADEVEFDALEDVAKESDIALKPIKKAIKGDPFMAVYAMNRLGIYAKDNISMADGAEEPELKEALLDAGTTASKHEKALRVLIEKWAPKELQGDEEK